MRAHTYTHTHSLTRHWEAADTPCPAPCLWCWSGLAALATHRSSVFPLPAVQGGSTAVGSNQPLRLGSDGSPVPSTTVLRPCSPRRTALQDVFSGTTSTVVSSTWQITSAQFTATTASVRPTLGAPRQGPGTATVQVPSFRAQGQALCGHLDEGLLKATRRGGRPPRPEPHWLQGPRDPHPACPPILASLLGAGAGCPHSRCSPVPSWWGQREPRAGH